MSPGQMFMDTCCVSHIHYINKPDRQIKLKFKTVTDSWLCFTTLIQQRNSLFKVLVSTYNNTV
jgi:hypothetical protein